MIAVTIRKGLLIGALIGALVFVASCTGGSHKDSEQTRAPAVTSQPEKASASTATQPQESLEYMLAGLNAGHSVPRDDITVKRFRYLLTEIQSKTVNTQKEIADMTYRAQLILRDDYGKDVRLLDLMEAANETIPAGMRMKYEEVMAAMLVLMGK